VAPATANEAKQRRPSRVVLIADPETPAPRLEQALAADAVVERLSPREVEALAAHHVPTPIDVVLVDARLCESCDVVGLVARLLRADPAARTIVLVDHAGAPEAEAALAAGAWQVTPRGDARALAHWVHVAGTLRSVEGQGSADDPAPREMIGVSEAMRRTFALIRKVAVSDLPVLLTGESGTGKELAAEAIHERSPRWKGPLVAINCAAIPDALLESELFGHERGAFTGAVHASPGKLASAHGGTLFLDEIGEMAPPLQAKLLRFLEDHTIERVGSQRAIPVDVRVIAATNADLERSVEGGSFRRDLYYRLAVFRIEMPPLRERPEDVLVMARVFLRRYASLAEATGLRGFSSDAVEALCKRAWPGNVRELANRIRRAVVVADGPLVTAADLDLEAPTEPPLLTLREALVQAEADCVRRALERAAGSRSEAARLLGVSRSTFYDLVRRHSPQRA
jgi:two-component system NtrC family response regulator